MSGVVRVAFADEGLWFEPLSQERLATTLAWRNKARIRTQLHDQSEISEESHRRWFADSYLPSSDAVWVFGDDSGPVGQVSLYEIGKTPMCVTFGRLLVGRDDAVGLGYGYRATVAAVRRAFLLGFGRVALDVKPGNHRAIHIYKKAGFREVGSIAGSDAVHMAAVPDGTSIHSVIVGSYNRPKYIAQTLQSIVSQTGPNWELIVSDDASSEETVSVIRRFTDGDPRCHLIEAPDRPPPGPRKNGNIRAIHRINDAIQKSTGDIIHYIPDDDFFAPNRFVSFEGAFRDPNVSMAYGKLKYVEGDKVTNRVLFPGGPVVDPLCKLDQSQVAHRRRCFERVPAWPTDDSVGYVVDGIFYKMLVEAGYGPIRPVNELVTFKRRHQFNMQKTTESSDERRE